MIPNQETLWAILAACSVIKNMIKSTLIECLILAVFLSYLFGISGALGMFLGPPTMGLVMIFLIIVLVKALAAEEKLKVPSK